MKYEVEAYDIAAAHGGEKAFRKIGEYDDLFSAVAASKRLIDAFLEEAYRNNPSMNAERLYL